jgi:CheY-like chemotaxis protein
MMTATRTRTCRVLIADDVADLRLLLRFALERSGAFEVVGEAADGAEAVARATEHLPDLVVLDLSMPVLDGLEALPFIRKAAPDARVVVLSGFAAAKMEERAIAAGAVAYFEKGDILAVAEALERIA